MAAAEAVFEAVKTRRKAEGEGALKEAAAAARHIGALAFQHDTDKALAAYREAGKLDPKNPEVWRQFGHLLKRASDLGNAEEMYRKSREIEEALGRKERMAAAARNLGILYQTRGELDRAEEMYRKALDLFREIGAAPMIEKMNDLLAKLREAE